MFIRDSPATLSAGHARALINAKDPLALAKTVIAKGLSVRATEKLATNAGVSARPSKATVAPKNSDTAALERDLSAELGFKVTISHDNGRGTISLNYASLDQLDDIIAKLKAGRASQAARDEGTLDLEEIIAERG